MNAEPELTASVSAEGKPFEEKGVEPPTCRGPEQAAIRWRTLVLIVLIALGLRIGWLVTQTDVIENEGAEYARIAQSLRNGSGYVGTMGGPQLLFPPLYPVLIAGVSFVSGNTESAARLISLAAGTLLVIPVFLIAWRVYGRRVAIVSALLITFYPLLIALSASTYSECLYITLLATGAYCGLRSLEIEKARHAIFAGIFLGLAYLTRPEALAYPVTLVVLILLAALIQRKGWKPAVSHSLYMLTFVTVLAAPYVIYLSVQAGQFRVEGKSEVNYVIGKRMNSGLPPSEASRGINENAEQEGPLLNPNRFIGSRIYPKSLKEVRHYVIASARRNLGGLYSLPIFLTLLLPWTMLTLLALFRTPWNRERARQEMLLICFFALAALPLAVGPFFSLRRLLLPLIPFAVLWSSKGIEELSDWVRTTRRELWTPSRWLKRVDLAVVAGLAVLLLFFGAQSLREFPELLSTKRDAAIKEAGLWLRHYDPGPKRVMDTGTIVSYYSSGTWMPLPSAGAPLILKYIGRENPEFVVVNLSPWNKGAPELRDLLDRDPKAQLVYQAGSGSGNAILIYRWS